jgi:polar amino acid transport system substrate-binding protein
VSRAVGLIPALLIIAFAIRDGHTAETNFADIERIIKARQLVVALPALARPPYVIDVEGEAPQGFDAWLAHKLAAALDVDLRLDRSATTSDELVDLVSAGKADLALGGIFVTAERALRVRFTRPYVREAPSLLLNRRGTMPFHSTCPTLDEMKDLLIKPNQVAVHKGSKVEAVVRQLVPDAAPKLFDEPVKQLAAVRAGDVLVSIHNEAQSRYLLDQQPSARIQIRSCLGGARSLLVAIAVRPDAPDLQRWVDTFLEAELLDLTAEELLQFGKQEKLWP